MTPDKNSNEFGDITIITDSNNHTVLTYDKIAGKIIEQNI